MHDRDVVVLEVWSETVNSYQLPSELLEPALGGPDTTEQVRLGMDFKILALTGTQDCTTVPLTATNQGTLQVSFAQSTTTGDPDCPQVIQGGYTGLEHALYRFEIARIDDGEWGYPASSAKFKYSRFNGGMVGRGYVSTAGGAGASGVVEVLANVQAIADASWAAQVYLEVLTLDDDETHPANPPTGRWKVVFGGMASVDSTQLATQNQLSLSVDVTSTHYGALPAVGSASDPTTQFFFRIWDGIESVQTYAGNTPAKELEYGILLSFSEASTDRYYPEDYWTVKVRAAITSDADSWASGIPPQGIVYHRVPVAELDWGGATSLTAGASIVSCIAPFQPLVDGDGCCCIDVEPGQSINNALQELKKRLGGCIYLKPGTHHISASIDLTGLTDILIKGEKYSTQVVVDPAGYAGAFPAFLCKDAFHLTFESFSVASSGGVSPIWSIDGTSDVTIREIEVGYVSTASVDPANTQPIVETSDICNNISIERCRFVGGKGMSVPGQATRIRLIDNDWVMMDYAVSVAGTYDFLIEGNTFSLVSQLFTPSELVDLTEPSNSVLTAGLKVLDPLFKAPATPPTTQQTGVILGNSTFGTVSRNLIQGAYGIVLSEVVSVTITDNNIGAMATGVVMGDGTEIRIEGNTFGDLWSGALAIYFCINAWDTRVVGNQIDCFTGIYAGDFGDGSYLVAQDVMGQMLQNNDSSAASVTAFLAAAQARGTFLSTLFQADTAGVEFAVTVDLMDNLHIEDNDLTCVLNGVFIEGMRSIGSLRVVGNSFFQCGLGAIQIEPANQSLVAAGSWAGPWLVADNRFDILGNALRSTLDEMTFSGNEIKINSVGQPAGDFGDLYNALATVVYQSSDMSTDIGNNDTTSLRLIAQDLMDGALSGAGSLDPSTVLSALAPLDDGSVFGGSDAVGTLREFIEALATQGSANLLLVETLNTYFDAMVNDLEGFAVSISGLLPKVTSNRIDSYAEYYYGGIALDLVSGEVKDNVVSVSYQALYVAGSLLDGLAQESPCLQITGNRLEASTRLEDWNGASALFVGQLADGASLQVADNQFSGNVLIGYAADFAAKNGKAASAEKAPDYGKVYGLSAQPASFNYFSGASAQPSTKNQGKIGLSPAANRNSKFLRNPPFPKKAQSVQFVSNRVLGYQVAIYLDLASIYKSGVAQPMVVFSNNVIFPSTNLTPTGWTEIYAFVSVITANVSETPIQFHDAYDNPDPLGDSWKVANVPTAVQI